MAIADKGCWLLPIVLGVVTSTCATRAPRPSGVAPGAPSVSWIIMHGDRDNPNREFACQSDPRSDCVLPASGAQNQVFSDVYVYYHGAGTKYVGSVRIGFFEGPPSGHEMKTDITVKPKESIANQSVTGIVTNTPGTYTMSFRLAATTSTGASEPVTAEVPVVVR